jgi:hypothetical protein
LPVQVGRQAPCSCVAVANWRAACSRTRGACCRRAIWLLYFDRPPFPVVQGPLDGYWSVYIVKTRPAGDHLARTALALAGPSASSALPLRSPATCHPCARRSAPPSLAHRQILTRGEDAALPCLPAVRPSVRQKRRQQTGLPTQPTSECHGVQRKAAPARLQFHATGGWGWHLPALSPPLPPPTGLLVGRRAPAARAMQAVVTRGIPRTGNSDLHWPFSPGFGVVPQWMQFRGRRWVGPRALTNTTGGATTACYARSHARAPAALGRPGVTETGGLGKGGTG